MTELSTEQLCHRSRLVWSVRQLKTSERLEILCALLRTKRLVRLVADDDTSKEYLVLAEAIGLKCQPSRVRQAPVRSVGGDVYTQTVPWEDARGQWFSVFLGQDDGLIEDAIRLEVEGADSETFGTLLGYPPCCIRLYNSFRDGGDWLETVLDLWPPGAVAFALSNPLARLFSDHGFLPDFFPCSLACPHALRIAERSREALLHLGYGEMAEAILCEVRKPILRVGRRSLVQLGVARRLPRCIEFDPADIRSYGTLPADLRDLLRSGELALKDDDRLELPDLTSRLSVVGARLIQFKA